MQDDSRCTSARLTCTVEDFVVANKESGVVGGRQLEGVSTGQRNPQLTIVPTRHGVVCHDSPTT